MRWSDGISARCVTTAGKPTREHVWRKLQVPVARQLRTPLTMRREIQIKNSQPTLPVVDFTFDACDADDLPSGPCLHLLCRHSTPQSKARAWGEHHAEITIDSNYHNRMKNTGLESLYLALAKSPVDFSTSLVSLRRQCNQQQEPTIQCPQAHGNK